MNTILNVATIGGGTGHYHLLRGLRRVANLSIAAIVTVADNGGSSGGLRDELGVLPPGDILKVLLALTNLDPDFTRNFLLNRFKAGKFKEHTIGNLLIAKHAERMGMLSAIEAMRFLLCVDHTVLPVTTLANIHLHATLSNGEKVHGEDKIDAYTGDERIEELRLSHAHAGVYPPVIRALLGSHFVIVAPGSLHTSLLPVLKMLSVSAALSESSAKRIFVCNTMTMKGDTHGMCPHEVVRSLELTMGCRFHTVLVNSSMLDEVVLQRYAGEGKFPVRCNGSCSIDARFIRRPLVTGNELVRHNYELLETALSEILRP